MTGFEEAYYLGLDGGGTKTAALVVDRDGAELGRGVGGPCNIVNTDDFALKASVRDAVRTAVQAADLPDDTPFTGICAAVAGFSVEVRREPFREILCSQARLVEGVDARVNCTVVPDYLAAFWGATHGEPGIVVIAGTGAVTFGRNEEGEEHREDGLGFLLGDRGSGFNLGLYSLRHTLTQMQKGACDDLSIAIMSETGATSQNEIVHWLYSGFSPTRVAGLSRVVGEFAEHGDSSARSLVSEMAHRLRNAVRVTRHKLWLPRSTPVYMLGGLWQMGAFLREEFIEPHWRPEGAHEADEPSLGGRFHIVEPASDAVYGATLLARDSGK